MLLLSTSRPGPAQPSGHQFALTIRRLVSADARARTLYAEAGIQLMGLEPDPICINGSSLAKVYGFIRIESARPGPPA